MPSTWARFSQAAIAYGARRVPCRPPALWKGQLIALACVIGGALLRALLEPVAHGHIPVVVFYPFVLVASIWGGALSGVSAWALGLVVADYFWLPRTGTAVTLAAFSLVCLFGVLIARLLCGVAGLHAREEERAVILAHEVNHRANNLLGVVQAISAQTARSAGSLSEYQAAFESRLAALAGAQHLIYGQAQPQPDLRSFLLQIVGPFGADRFEFEGPAVAVPQGLGASFALLLHELGVNATRYGALSAPHGKVQVRWESVGQDGIRFDWRETGGPPVTAPTRAGFGSRLLKTAFPPEYGGASMTFHPDGVRCTVHLPGARGAH